MKQIDLGRGMSALVDDCDFERLSKFKWYAVKGKYTYYAARSDGANKVVLMHRQILGVTDRNTLTDHENGNGLDNQRFNIRTCTFSENNRNKRGYKNSGEKIKGVQKAKNKNSEKWAARISHNKKLIYLGCFNTKQEAAHAYNEKAKELHGEFAYLNKID